MHHFILKSVGSLSSLAPSAHEQEEALQFHTGTHRSQSAVLLVEQGITTLQEINDRIPPSDLSWTRSILAEPIEVGWIRRTPGNYSRFELTMNGRRMLDVLALLPEDLKDKAWLAVWRPEQI
jgi:hypothetical protein